MKYLERCVPILSLFCLFLIDAVIPCNIVYNCILLYQQKRTRLQFHFGPGIQILQIMWGGMCQTKETKLNFCASFITKMFQVYGEMSENLNYTGVFAVAKWHWRELGTWNNKKWKESKTRSKEHVKWSCLVIFWYFYDEIRSIKVQSMPFIWCL